MRKYIVIALLLSMSSCVAIAGIDAPRDEFEKLDGCTTINAYSGCYFSQANGCDAIVNQVVFESGEGGELNTRLHRGAEIRESYFYDVNTMTKTAEFGGRWVNEEAKAYVFRGGQYNMTYYLDGHHKDGDCGNSR